MLIISKNKSKYSIIARRSSMIFAILLVLGGFYTLSLMLSPAAAPILVTKPIKVSALPKPAISDNRIIIPKIGVNIEYAPGAESLDKGAEWRYPSRGNPYIGGNFIIAAHRLSIQPTPKATIIKSPFYNIDKLDLGDKIIVDYNGIRYAYDIEQIFNVLPTQTEIEAPTENPRLTLYTCELSGSASGRVVITAKPLGAVALTDDTK